MTETYIDWMDMRDRKKAVSAEVGLSVVGDDACNHFCGTGSSRRVKEDAYDEHLGVLIAYTRAVENLAQQMKTELKRRLKAAGNDTEAD